MAGAFDEVAAMRDEHPTTAGGDDLVAVEREGSALAEGAGALRTVGRAQRFRRVFDQRDAVAVADLLCPLVVAALAIEINAEHRGELPAAAPRTRGQFLFQEARIHRPA